MLSVKIIDTPYLIYLIAYRFMICLEWLEIRERSGFLKTHFYLNSFDKNCKTYFDSVSKAMLSACQDSNFVFLKWLILN